MRDTIKKLTQNDQEEDSGSIWQVLIFQFGSRLESKVESVTLNTIILKQSKTSIIRRSVGHIVSLLYCFCRDVSYIVPPPSNTVHANHHCTTTPSCNKDKFKAI